MYTIAHVPGKSLVSADALSRVPQERPLTEADVLSTDEVTAQANLVEVRYLQQRSAWPRSGRDNSKTACVDRLSATVRRVGPATFLAIGAEDFWQVQNDLTIQNGILKGIWLVIPTCMRATGKLHEDHQGVVRYRSRAQSSLWWLGPSCQLEELVRIFSECPPQSTSLDVSLPPSPPPLLLSLASLLPLSSLRCPSLHRSLCHVLASSLTLSPSRRPYLVPSLPRSFPSSTLHPFLPPHSIASSLPPPPLPPSFCSLSPSLLASFLPASHRPTQCTLTVRGRARTRARVCVCVRACVRACVFGKLLDLRIVQGLFMRGTETIV